MALHQTVLPVLRGNTKTVIPLPTTVVNLAPLENIKTVPGKTIVKHAATDSFRIAVPGPPVTPVQMAGTLPLMNQKTNASQVESVTLVNTYLRLVAQRPIMFVPGAKLENTSPTTQRWLLPVRIV
jgi:hypothetical protein